jgi:hypothetical protein
MKTKLIRPKYYSVTKYWLDYYCDDHCTLCGNRGWIDTRGVRTAAGVEVGRVNYCICPNGQALRACGAGLHNAEIRGGEAVPLD